MEDDIIKKEIDFLLYDSYEGKEIYRYIYKDIFILDCSLNGNKRIYSGKIIKIINSIFHFESRNFIYSDYYSCFPIILGENFTNIGIFLGMNNKFNNINIGEFIGIIKNDINRNFENMKENKINNNRNNNIKYNLNIINISFVNGKKKSNSIIISTSKNNTIRNLLEMYCKKTDINYKDYSFFYNGISLNYKSKESLQNFHDLSSILISEKMQTIGA